MDLTGEAIVAAAIALRVVAKLAFSHLYEALAICGLCVSALTVEKEYGLRQVQFRPVASSGILLGTITWPLVLASRLRLQSAPNGKLAFWTAILCSFRLLSVISCSSARQDKPSFFARLELLFRLKVGVPFFYLCAIFLAWSTGLQCATILIVQVIGSGVFLREISRRFPGCASAGEASLIASGLALYAGDILNTSSFEKDNLVDNMLKVAIVGLSVMPLLYRAFMWLTRSRKGPSFAGAFLLVVTIFAPAWLRFVVGLHRHPVLWVVDFVMEKPLQRFGLCMYWIFILCILPYLYRVARDDRVPQIIVRKSYHVLAVIMFVPAVLLQYEFLHLAFTVAFVLFGLVEMLRIWQVPPLGPKVKDFMRVFADHRDSEKLIISHFSLLLGCALPVWLHAKGETRPLAPFAGLLSIGIGDTMASFVGYNYGSWKLSRTNNKTVEGTTAGIMSLVLSCALLQTYVSAGCFQTTTQTTIAAILAGLVEAYTSQLDNIFVPLLFYALLCI